MKKFSTLAFAAALIGTMSVSAIAPNAAFAQSQDNTSSAEQKQKGKGKGHMRPARGGHGFLGLVCAPEGAEQSNERLEKMAEHLELTDAQAEAFATFKTAAQTAQTELSDACAPLKPAEGVELSPVERMENRNAMMQLQLEAMSDVTPAFADFYETLTDDQKQKLNEAGPKKHKRGDRGSRGDKNK